MICGDTCEQDLRFFLPLVLVAVLPGVSLLGHYLCSMPFFANRGRRKSVIGARQQRRVSLHKLLQKQQKQLNVYYKKVERSLRKIEKSLLNLSAQQSQLSAAERDKMKNYLIDLDDWKTCKKAFMLFPVGPRKQAWDLLILVVVLHSCAILPYRWAFAAPATGWTQVVEMALQGLFVVDVVIQFNTAVLEDERWVVHRPRIATIYLSGWFWVDLPSSIPYEFIDLFVDHSGYEALLPLLRVLRLFRLFRLLKLLKVGELVRQIEEMFEVNLKALRMLNTVALLMAFCHLLACLFYAVGVATAQDDPEVKSWINTYDGGIVADPATTPFQAYTVALFWAIGLVCGQGTEVQPENLPERTLSILVYLLTALFFAYVIAVVTEQLSAYVNDPSYKAMDDLIAFMRFHRMTKGLETKLKSYYTVFLHSRSMVDEERILRNLTPSLRDEVMDHLLASTVRTCPLFCPAFEEEVLQTFQEAIYAELKPLNYERGMIIAPKGSLQEDLYFLVKGQASAVSVSFMGSEEDHLTLQHPLFPIDEAGTLFGEACLMDRPNEVDYLAASRLELLCVPKSCLIDAARQHLHALAPDEVRAQIATSVWAETVRKQRLRVWGMRLTYANLADRLESGEFQGDFPGATEEEWTEIKVALLIQTAYVRLTLKRLMNTPPSKAVPKLVEGASAVKLHTRHSTGQHEHEAPAHPRRTIVPAARRPRRTSVTGAAGAGREVPVQSRIDGLESKLEAFATHMGAKVDALASQMSQMLAAHDKMMERLAAAPPPPRDNSPPPPSSQGGGSSRASFLPSLPSIPSSRRAGSGGGELRA